MECGPAKHRSRNKCRILGWRAASVSSGVIRPLAKSLTLNEELPAASRPPLADQHLARHLFLEPC